ncbi:MAG: hypothetical protein K8R23_08400 [Chthoniobacter sp.]|nr:hypothetical protein [Chthoniobacter sp.]
MNAPTITYRRLAGRGLSLTGFARLWLAEDHLLEVNSLLISERYRRFFFKDVTALVIQRTKVRFAWNIVHGILGGGGALLAGGLWWGGASASEQELRVTLWVLAGIVGAGAAVFLILLFLNILLGPTCMCHIQTSTAGWHALAAPTRLRPAQLFLARLIPLIEAVQADSQPAADTAPAPLPS